MQTTLPLGIVESVAIECDTPEPYSVSESAGDASQRGVVKSVAIWGVSLLPVCRCPWSFRLLNFSQPLTFRRSCRLQRWRTGLSRCFLP
jgi:hypothetical protein